MYLKIFGLLLVFDIFQSALAQCSDYRKCKTCLNSTYCAQCEENYYATTPDNDGCCSRGCAGLGNQPSCDLTTGRCTLDNCTSDGNLYVGPECLPCPIIIDNCDICSDNGTVICLTCVPGYAPTSNDQKCCPVGCADCVDGCSSEASTCECTACNLGWSPYLIGCDTCSDNCPRPDNNSTRCDPADGKCSAPCAEGRFGSWCNVTCTINFCNECVYDEPNKRLTCASCADGYYGLQCTPCSQNCRTDPDPRVCQQDNGYCTNACNPGWRGNQCEIGCRDAAGLQNCQQCERFDFVCTKCDTGWFNTTCQQGCNINCGETEIGGGETVSACDISNGTCLTGCKPQHYKPDCSGYCPNCVNDICDRTTGICVESACKPGNFGLECNNTCPTTCRNNNVTGLPECNYTDGSCIHGCDYNRYGSHCEFECSQYCQPVATGNITECSDYRKCKTCLNSTYCAQCEENYYATTPDNDGCCSRGCAELGNQASCDLTTGRCTLDDCKSDGNLYAGPECLPCPVIINNCDICNDNGTVICHTCLPGYAPTVNQQKCCPIGCADCVDGCSSEASTCECTACNLGWSPYLIGCDTCSDNCPRPDNNSTRCDPADGKCSAPCAEGRFGSWCNVTCTINFCNECVYDEPNKLLTCSSCAGGYYGPQCTPCSQNCRIDPDPRVCQQDNGYCTNGCNPGWRGNQCEIGCRDAAGLQNCQQCERFYFVCTKCYAGWFNTTCQQGCNVNCGETEIGGGETVSACDISNGTCLTGCKPQHYKPDCSGYCPNCVNEICDRTTGICLESACKPGYFGLECNNTCPTTCRNNNVTGLPECNYTDGSCKHGCDYNRYGGHCEFECSQYCQPVATVNITVESEPSCHQFNGTCKKECVNEYYLHNCTKKCGSLCVDNTCNITSKTCEFCNVPGNIVCPTADPFSNNKKDNTFVIGGAVGGGGLAVILIVVGLVFIYLRKRHKVDKHTRHLGDKTETTYYNTVQLEAIYETITDTDRSVYEGFGPVTENEHAYDTLKENGTAETSVGPIGYENVPKALQSNRTTQS